MWKNYKISEENKGGFEELCKKFRRSPGVFQCKHMDLMSLHEENIQQDAHKEQLACKKIKLNTSTTSPLKTSDVKDCQLSSVPDVETMQKNIISSLNSSEKVNSELYISIEPLTVCNSGAPIISDEVLFHVCKKSEKSDETIAAILGTLFILPKLYHLPSKLSTPAVDALSEFIQCHPEVTVTQVLVPLLQHCPETGEQHRDALAHIMSACSPQHVTQMLSAISIRESMHDVDVQIFYLLCEHADQQSPATHTAVLTFLNKTCDKYKTSVKFGHCLLSVVKKMGQHINDHENLQLIIKSHSSSLKKAIEVQMKKVMKNR